MSSTAFKLKMVAAVAATFLLSIAFIETLSSCSDNKYLFRINRIAHAGGGLNFTTFTNSYEALEKNYQNKFEYFEIDFSYTSDGKLVCIHDWDNTFEKIYGYKLNAVPTYNEFINLNSGTRSCTLEGLAIWMKKREKAAIVLDIKDPNSGEKYIETLNKIFSVLPNPENRVIPQVYFPEDYNEVRKIGFNSIIWTLYAYSGTDSDVLNWTSTFEGAFAVTMPKGSAKTSLPKALRSNNIPTYVHTLNNPIFAYIYTRWYGVTDIYTDFLPAKIFLCTKKS